LTARKAVAVAAVTASKRLIATVVVVTETSRGVVRA